MNRSLVTTGRVLVLEADKRQGLATIRNLGRNGLSVTAASNRRVNAGPWSRYADRHVRYPSPRRDRRGFIEAIERELETREYDVLLPIADLTLHPVLQERERLEAHAVVPYAPTGTVMAGLDKLRTIEAAREVGIPHPTTIAPSELDADTVASEIGYPVVIKPRQATGREGVHLCSAPSDLEEVYEPTHERYGPLLVQEYIPNGGEQGVYTLYDRSSELAAVTVQRRLRSKYPDGGASTLRETISNPELISLADGLLSALDWSGVAMVEFRIDPRDGQSKLMEINPRFWGSLALSIRAGVDFPYLLYQQVIDGTVEPTLAYDTDVEVQWLLGDIVQALGTDDPIATLRGCFGRTEKARYYDVLSRSDPLPGLGYVLYHVCQSVSHRIPDRRRLSGLVRTALETARDRITD